VIRWRSGLLPAHGDPDPDPVDDRRLPLAIKVRAEAAHDRLAANRIVERAL